MTSDFKSTQCAYPKDDSATCDKCGRFGVLEVNGQRLCEGCLALCGSCCPEFQEEPETTGSGTGVPPVQ